MEVYERIKMRRKELGLSADDVAAALGLSRATIFRYESAEIEKMPIQIIDPLSKVLRCSPAWLLGWEDADDPEHNNSELMSHDIMCKVFAKNLNYYMKLNGKTQDDLVRDLWVSDEWASDWCSGLRYPNNDDIRSLCNYLHVTRTELLYVDLSSSTPSELHLSREETDVILEYRKSDDFTKSMVHRILGYSKQLPRKEGDDNEV